MDEIKKYNKSIILSGKLSVDCLALEIEQSGLVINFDGITTSDEEISLYGISITDEGDLQSLIEDHNPCGSVVVKTNFCMSCGVVFSNSSEINNHLSLNSSHIIINGYKNNSFDGKYKSIYINRSDGVDKKIKLNNSDEIVID